jgi:hypothetical protein
MISTSSLRKYTESGIAPPLNIVGLLILAIVSSLALGFVYNVLIRFISFIYVNVIILFGFGYTLAYLSRGLNLLFKIRSKKISMLITAAIGILSIYIQWVCFVYIFFVEDLAPIQDIQSILNFMVHPDFLINSIMEINEYGTWVIGETPINGTILWWIWLGEALLMIAIPLRLYMLFDVLPFSEADNRWYKKKKIDQQFEYILLRQNFLKSFAENPTESLKSLGKPDYNRYSNAYIYSDKNKRSFLIEIENVTVDSKANKDYFEVLPPSHIGLEEIKKLETSFNIV